MQLRIQYTFLSILVFCGVGQSNAVTIKALLQEKKTLPSLILADKILPMPFFSLTSLDGLEAIPNIEQARVIILSGNKLRRIKKDTFNSPKFKNLRWLDLGNCGIEIVEEGGFNGLENLRYLFLNDNQLKTLPNGALGGMPQLIYASLGNNPGKTLLYDQAQKQVPTTTKIYTGQITKKFIAQAVTVAIALAGTAVALLAIYGAGKKQPAQRTGTASGEQLRTAIERGDIVLAKELFEQGASARELDQQGLNAIDLILIGQELRTKPEKRIELLNYFLDKDPELVNILSRELKTPLHFAVITGDEGVVTLLLERGANINAADDRGQTPMFGVLGAHNQVILTRLLNYKANINHQDRGGNTLLHEAAADRYADRNLEIVKLLLQKGADPSLLNNAKKTALDVTKENPEATAIAQTLEAEEL